MIASFASRPVPYSIGPFVNSVRTLVLAAILGLAVTPSWVVAAPGEVLKLPVPRGLEMAFRRIDLGDTLAGSSLRRVRIGYRDEFSGIFWERPAVVNLGGSFVERDSRPNRWYYYLAKFEVTRAQFDAVMASQVGSSKRDQHQDDLNLPVASVTWFDVQEFLRRYNRWLIQNHRDQIPKRDETVGKDLIGFVRLPTELEWEFAARGGDAVDELRFQGIHPYEDSIRHFEWYAGNVRGNGPQPVGLRKPNPVGIHDLLGNVRELTMSPFRLQYVQGAVGGLTSRGGDFLMNEKAIRASRRDELPLYDSVSGEPTKSRTLGFRLAIGVPVINETTPPRSLELEPLEPAPPISLDGIEAQQTLQQLSEAEKALRRIKEALLRNGSLDGGLEGQFGIIESELANVGTLVAWSEQREANLFVRWGDQNAFYWSHSLQPGRKPDSPREDRHIKVMSRLTDLTPERINTAFRNRQDYLSRLASDEPNPMIRKRIEIQLRICEILERQYLELRRGELALENANTVWRNEFAAVHWPTASP